MSGWKRQFCKCHGIGMLMEHGEKASTDCLAAKKFISFVHMFLLCVFILI